MSHGGKRTGAGRPYGSSPNAPSHPDSVTNAEAGLEDWPRGPGNTMPPAERMARSLAKDLAWRKKHPGFRGCAPGKRGSKVVSQTEKDAIRTLGPRWRVPKEAPPEVAELADEALGSIVDVMRQKVYFKQAKNVLAAATTVREEVCGPPRQQIDLNAKVTYEDLVNASLAEPGPGQPNSAASAVVEAKASELTHEPS